jgi:hypothetical protein
MYSFMLSDPDQRLRCMKMSRLSTERGRVLVVFILRGSERGSGKLP